MQGNPGLDAGDAPENQRPERGESATPAEKAGQEAAPKSGGSRPARQRAPKTGDEQPKQSAARPAAGAGGKPAGQPRQGAQRKAPAGADKSVRPAVPQRPMVKPRLLVRYHTEVADILKREFGYSNSMQVPRLKKIVLNIGLGEALKNAGAVEAATRDITAIAGQKPVVTKSRLSIANFGLREGQVVGVMVTLRDARMWHFLDRLASFALPRVRDFRGVPRNSFDGRGSYTLGLADQIVFPEIDYNKIDRLRGLQVTIVTSARTDEEARRLLELLGMPFVRVAERVARSA